MDESFSDTDSEIDEFIFTGEDILVDIETLENQGEAHYEPDTDPYPTEIENEIYHIDKPWEEITSQNFDFITNCVKQDNDFQEKIENSD